MIQSEQRYMIMRRVLTVWVPLTMWSDVQGIDLETVSVVGFEREQALRLINLNREMMQLAGWRPQYRMVPMDDFLRQEME